MQFNNVYFNHLRFTIYSSPEMYVQCTVNITTCHFTIYDCNNSENLTFNLHLNLRIIKLLIKVIEQIKSMLLQCDFSLLLQYQQHHSGYHSLLHPVAHCSQWQCCVEYSMQQQ